MEIGIKLSDELSVNMITIIIRYMEKRKFKHNHLPNLTCEIVAPTNKGYKVLQTEVYHGRKKPKTITTYYNDRDFKKGGLWTEIKEEVTKINEIKERLQGRYQPEPTKNGSQPSLIDLFE